MPTVGLSPNASGNRRTETGITPEPAFLVFPFGDATVSGTGLRGVRIDHNPAKLESRRHVLEALTLAPRFREAHRLLLTVAAPTETEGDQPTVP